MEIFERYEVKHINGQTQIMLYFNPYQVEFSLELGDREISNKKADLRTAAIEYVRRNVPKIKNATIAIMAGAMVVTAFPMQKAEAHEAQFSMSYLYFGSTSSYITQVDRTRGSLNTVSPSFFDLNADGTLKISNQFDPRLVSEMHNRGIRVVPFLSNHWDREIGRAALANREQLSQQIADFIVENNLDGVNVDIENVTDVDRDNYTDLVRLINKKLPEGKEVSVAVAANPHGWTKGWHGSYDYKALATHADYLMIMAYDESYPGSEEKPVASYPWVEKSIQYTLNQGVAGDKIVLGIPHYGRYWKEDGTYRGLGISNSRMPELLSKYESKVEFDEITKSPKATIIIKDGDQTVTIGGKIWGPGTYHIWYENNDSIQAKLNLVHKYSLKGTGSWSLGQENPEIWNVYKQMLTTHSDMVPVITSPTSENTAPTTTTGEKTYTVQLGDSLWKIATSNKLSVEQLKQYNDLKSDTVYVGQILRLTPKETTTSPTVTVPAPTAGQIAPKKTTPTVPSVKTPTPSKVQPVPKKATIVGTTMVPKVQNVSLYSSATTKAKIIKRLKITDEVKILQESTDKKGVKWVKVQSKTSTGWVAYSRLTTKKITIPSKPTTVTTLKMGSRGAAVTDLQNKLRKTGHYKKAPNGVYDATTRAAVIAFQRKYRLAVDGVAGKGTITKLNSVIGTR